MATLWRPEASLGSGWGKRNEKARVAWPISFHGFFFLQWLGMGLTQPEGKHVGQRPRCVVHDVELAAYQHYEPSPRPLAERPLHTPRKDNQACRIEQPQDGPHYKLSILES